jgi:hypothetical protein
VSELPGSCGQGGAEFNVESAFVEVHPDFLREQEEIDRLDDKDRLSEAVARLGTHASGGAGEHLIHFSQEHQRAQALMMRLRRT